MIKHSCLIPKSLAVILAIAATTIVADLCPCGSNAQASSTPESQVSTQIAPKVPRREWQLPKPGQESLSRTPRSQQGNTQFSGNTRAHYEPDCNDPDAHDINCTEPSYAKIEQAHKQGYPYYIGHAEPTTEFFSTRATSGSNMQWKFQLPASEPTPSQNGSKVANFELYSAFWMGLALCDPNSDPFGACTAVSDSNNPNTAGAAFLELQFYPPGSPFGSCSNTQWCANLHINTLEDNNTFQSKNCQEPTTAAYVTTDGTPGGTKLLMSAGDTILVTIKDTSNGLETDIRDLTTSTSGTMVASGANGFVHNSDTTTCATTAFNFHPMYATAKTGQVVQWAAIRPNVSFDFEIGHFELCGNTSCSIPPDGGDADETGTCSVTKTQVCTKNSDCPGAETCQNGCGTIRGIGGCINGDLDHDGTPYLADWPDGDTTTHPASVIIGSADDKGIGPLSGNGEGYTTVNFVSSEATNGAFYPFYSQAGTGTSCRFYFGNDIPGTTTDDFGKAAQYGTSISNPCLPGTASDLTIKKQAAATVIAGTDLTYTIDVTNHGPNDATNLVLTDTLPSGVVLGSITGPNAGSCNRVASTLTCKPGNLADGANLTYTITVHIPSAGVGISSITNAATIAADQLDPNPADNTASATTTVVLQADLSITKSASPNPVAAGTSLTYKITIHNAGPSDANGVTVTDALPAGVTFSSGPCTGVSVLVCNQGTLVSGASKTLTIKIAIPADYLSSRDETTAQIANSAKVASGVTDPNPVNNTASVKTNVIAVADLDLTMTALPNPVHEGNIVTYTMSFTNTGPSDAAQGFILDYIPNGFTFAGSSGLPCGSGVGTVLCNLGPVIPAGFKMSITIQMKVPSNFLQPGQTSSIVTNTAKITSYTADSDAGDGPSLVNITVVP
jgi:uncharacterized repeat protein (TIGR01451 family)